MKKTGEIQIKPVVYLGAMKPHLFHFGNCTMAI